MQACRLLHPCTHLQTQHTHTHTHTHDGSTPTVRYVLHGGGVTQSLRAVRSSVGACHCVYQGELLFPRQCLRLCALVYVAVCAFSPVCVCVRMCARVSKLPCSYSTCVSVYSPSVSACACVCVCVHSYVCEREREKIMTSAFPQETWGKRPSLGVPFSL